MQYMCTLLSIDFKLIPTQQGLTFARDAKNPDSNHYAYPIPLIPVMDAYSKEIIRVDKLATGGREDGLKIGTHAKKIIQHCTAAEYGKCLKRFRRKICLITEFCTFGEKYTNPQSLSPRTPLATTSNGHQATQCGSAGRPFFSDRWKFDSVAKMEVSTRLQPKRRSNTSRC